MDATTELDPERILEILESANAQVLSPDEGLRERKKRRLRQRISNVATALFLAEGFEAVSVARIARAERGLGTDRLQLLPDQGVDVLRRGD